jgi:diguanylate cyclase (GGDEF)-like protein
MVDTPLSTAPPRAEDTLRGALLDSRRRWRDLAAMAADFIFETDEWGRLILAEPDPALGWSAAGLLGKPAARLLIDPAGFNPFRVTTEIRHRPVWFRRGDGGQTRCLVAATPILDPAGGFAGVRGLGLDMTRIDTERDGMASALRRGEALEALLRQTSREVLAPRMMRAALTAVSNALGAEGAAVALSGADGTGCQLIHSVGEGATAVRVSVAAAMPLAPDSVVAISGADGRPLLLTACASRFGPFGVIAVWRSADGRLWDDDDRALLLASGAVFRMVLEHESVQREMRQQARTDPLTNLLNRRAFLEELERNVDRLDRDDAPGTLMFVDLDHFKAVNDTNGHEAGDQVLIITANMLRRMVRPTDLVARLGGDEFAVWMNGVDHMTAAERADVMRDILPKEVAETLGAEMPRVGLSIGIACRRQGGHEAIDSVIRRADMAMYEVKRHGRGHWRVSLLDPTLETDQ